MVAAKIYPLLVAYPNPHLLFWGQPLPVWSILAAVPSAVSRRTVEQLQWWKLQHYAGKLRDMAGDIIWLSYRLAWKKLRRICSEGRPRACERLLAYLCRGVWRIQESIARAMTALWRESGEMNGSMRFSHRIILLKPHWKHQSMQAIGGMDDVGDMWRAFQ